MTKYKVATPKLNWETVKEDAKSFEADSKEICELAIKQGANLAKLIEAAHVVCDERVTLKCRIPPCESYGVNLMCPPFSPTATETASIVAKYKWGILLAVETTVPQKHWEWIQREGVPYCKMWRERKYALFYEQFAIPYWRKLHDIVMMVEREGHNRGYFFAVGYVSWSCYLCWRKGTSGKKAFDFCNTNAPCIRPYEARPSMEASGIDVYSTYKNAGLELKMASQEKLAFSGLVLVV
ncbi:MAG: DUF2284 domain-containing protein [Dehalococcoidia bacterium]